jgi:hypothetical protein
LTAKILKVEEHFLYAPSIVLGPQWISNTVSLINKSVIQKSIPDYPES